MKIIFKSKKKKISTEIGFEKPGNNNINNIPIIIENNDKPVFKNSKLIMPKYVVKKDKS